MKKTIDIVIEQLELIESRIAALRKVIAEKYPEEVRAVADRLRKRLSGDEYPSDPELGDEIANEVEKAFEECAKSDDEAA